MKIKTTIKHTTFSTALLLAAVTGCGVVHAEPLFRDSSHAEHFVAPDALRALPLAAREQFARTLAPLEMSGLTALECHSIFEGIDDLRPSTVEQFCAYFDLEVALLGDSPPGEASPMARLVADHSTRFSDYLVLRLGAERELMMAPVRPPQREAHPGEHAWYAAWVLESGDTNIAETATLALSAERCPKRCALQALILRQRAAIAFANAQREPAIALAQQAAQALRRAPTSEQSLVPMLASGVAELLAALSETKAAFDLLDWAQELAQARLPAGHPAAMHIGVMRFALTANEGSTARAAELLDALRERYPRLDSRARTRQRLLVGTGAQGFMRGTYQEGIDATISAQNILSSQLGSSAPAIGEALNIRGLCEAGYDRNAEAIKLYQQARAIREQAFSSNHPLIAELNHNQSVLFHNMGRYDLAEVFSQRALDGDRAFYGRDHEEVASGLSTLAAVYRNMGEPARAIELLREAVAITTRALGPGHRRTAIMHHSLGQAYLEGGDNDSALASFQTSIDIHTANDPAIRNIPIGLHNLATAANRLGRYKTAQKTLGEVLTRYSEIYGPGHRRVASAYRELAVSQVGLGDDAGADASLMEAMTILSLSDAWEVRWRVMFELAQFEWRQNRPRSAALFGKLALDVLQQLRSTQGSLGTRLQRSFARQRADSYRVVARWLTRTNRLLEAQNILGMLREEEFFDFTRQQRNDNVHHVQLSAAETKARQRLNKMQDRVRTDASKLADFRAELAVVRREFSAPLRRDAVRERRMLARPSRGSAAVYFVVGHDSTQVIAVTAKTERAHEIPMGRTELAQAVLELRQKLTDPKGDYLASARSLYDRLFDPVMAELEKQNVTRLWLHLDDALRYLPVGVLHDGQQHLVERYVLARRYRQAVATPAATRSNRVAAFALTQAHPGFAALPAAMAEADAIVRRDATDQEGAFAGNVWRDEQFDRAQLLGAMAGDFGRVHVASHFEFVPGNERDSFLLLGDGNRMSLYEWRTAELSLAGTELVTLSGCNTALHDATADGREMDGFAQIALRQGVGSIAASLWPVDDAATASFMRTFYQHQAGGDDPATALSRTQAALVERHPYYWAPFVLWTQSAN